MPTPPNNLPPAPAGNQARNLGKRFTWTSMKDTNKSTNIQPLKERAQTGLAECNSKSSLVKHTISAYRLRWEKLKAYLEKAFDSPDIDYSNKLEDEISTYKDKFVVHLPRSLSDTELKEIDGLREGQDEGVEIRPRDEFDE